MSTKPVEQVIGSQVAVPNSLQYLLEGIGGVEYQIQISWPLHWSLSNAGKPKLVPFLYILDGNALFLTATETAWRRGTSPHFADGGVIVAVGYPLQTDKLYDAKRRAFDFTPPTEPAVEGCGNAQKLLQFIQGPLKASLESRLPHVHASRQALYGHSLGGLFALYTLLTAPTTFDCFISSSPSVWFSDGWLLKNFTELMSHSLKSGDSDHRPSVLITWGGIEQDPPQKVGEEPQVWEARRKVDQDFRIVDNAQELVQLLRQCEHLGPVLSAGFDGEEHTSVMACSLNRGLALFFEYWPWQKGR